MDGQNLTMRNGLAKKLENHAHAVSLHFFHCSFIRIHKIADDPGHGGCVTDRLYEVTYLASLRSTRRAKRLRFQTAPLREPAHKASTNLKAACHGGHVSTSAAPPQRKLAATLATVARLQPMVT